MKEVSRSDITVPSSVPSSNDGAYKDNYLQASAGSGIFTIIDDIVKSPYLDSGKINFSLELLNALKQSTLLITLGRLSLLSDKYKEGSYIVDLNPTINLTNDIITLSPGNVSTILMLKEKKVPINGININIAYSDLTNSSQIKLYSELIAEAHKSGLLTFLTITSDTLNYIEIVKVGSILAPDFIIVNSKLQFNAETDRLVDLPWRFILSDSGISQSQDLFNNIDLFKAKGVKGVKVSDSIFTRDLEDSKKLVEACSLILHEDKDPDDAYDYLIA